MNFSARASIAACILSVGVFARVAQAADAAQVVDLWPEGVPGLRADASDEKIVNGRVTNVHRPTLTIYNPDAKAANETAVIFCPGGGYVKLAIGEGGGAETRWLNSVGVTVFILKYRLAEYPYPADLRDVLRAIRTVRSRAKEFHVQADRIGLLGESSGGHVAGCAATMWDDPDGRTGAPLDSISARPDFVALIYPVVTMEDPFAHKGSRTVLLGKSPSKEAMARLSIEKRVRKDMPPVFIVATMADKSVPVENSLHLAEALHDAGVPTDLHVYAQGSHGDSLDPRYGPTALWPQRCEEWMRFNGWLSRRQ